MNKIEINKALSGDIIKSIISSQPQLNYNVIQTALRKKDIKVNGKRISSSVTLLGGEKIELYIPSPKEINIPVVFEDDNIIIVTKPQGMEVTIADKVFDKSKCLEEYFIPYKAVHRLDKNTEGMVILAKTDKAYNAMVQGFKQSAIKKQYLALVAGTPKPAKANLFDFLVKGEKEVKVYSSPVLNSVPIKTNYETIWSNGECSLLNIELLTGKTHQIRAHLAHYNINLIGDEKYGSKTVNKKFKMHVQCLCAYKLNFNFLPNNFLNYLNQKSFNIKPSFLTDDMKF